MTDVQASFGPLIAQALPRPQDFLSPCLWASIVVCKGIVADTSVCKPLKPLSRPVSASVFMGVPSGR